jgi:site-specific DNA recombinase
VTVSDSRRCVVYTRKSTEEGLDQAFNSLDAQREACEAYVKSQAHEGWKLVESIYDDGGFSGGTMERPALSRLLDDVKMTKVDIVVVYKVDRLTRSLSDFSKIVEIFDAHGASFVSVTQQFNTTSSMGRLTLNVLLSFAQFEREVTGERIRDKFAASRRKGLWMGGTTPLGYRVKNRQLLVHVADAKLVRQIFRRFLVLRSVSALCLELQTKGIRRNIQTTERGKTIGGRPFVRGTLTHILQNKIYRGIVAHKDEAYQGQHPSIVSQELWDRVQCQLALAQREHQWARTVASPHLLIGRIWDDCGNVMRPTFARNRNGQQYRYYVSRALLVNSNSKESAGSLSRVPATSVEALVESEVLRRLTIPKTERWKVATRSQRTEILRGAIVQVVVGREEVDVVLSPKGLGLHLDVAADSNDSSREKPMSIRLPTRLKWWGGAKTITSLDGTMPYHPVPERNLIRALAYAQRWRGLLKSGKAGAIRDLAHGCGLDAGEVRAQLPLAFLSPRIVEALTDQPQPLTVAFARIAEVSRLVSWAEQERLIFDGN